jgi:hypothetical protein
VSELPTGLGHGGTPDQSKSLHSRLWVSLPFRGDLSWPSAASAWDARVADGLGQNLIQLGLGLLRIALEGSLLRFDHKQYVGMPEWELIHEGKKSGNKQNLQSGRG